MVLYTGKSFEGESSFSATHESFLHEIWDVPHTYTCTHKPMGLVD